MSVYEQIASRTRTKRHRKVLNDQKLDEQVEESKDGDNDDEDDDDDRSSVVLQVSDSSSEGSFINQTITKQIPSARDDFEPFIRTIDLHNQADDVKRSQLLHSRQVIMIVAADDDDGTGECVCCSSRQNSLIFECPS